MQHKMLQLIAFLINRINKKQYSEDGIKSITKDLKSEGYTQKEINFAISWIEDTINQSFDEKKQSFRVLNQVESYILEPESYGYLLKLYKSKLLSDEEVETVIEYACNLGIGKVTINDINEIISALELSFEAKAKKRFMNYINNSSKEIN